LFVVTKTELVTTLPPHQIFRIVSCKAIPCFNQENPISKEESHLETVYLKDIIQILESGQMYFSPTYDLTMSMQKTAQFHSNIKKYEVMESNEFHINAYFEKEFTKIPMNRSWLFKIIYGYVGSRSMWDTCSNGHHKTIESDSNQFYHTFPLVLIARLSRSRIGKRYFRRGLDGSGHSAIFVEMEQILVNPTQSRIASFVQTRGSVPLVWGHSLNFHYKPPLVILPPTSSNLKSVKQHFDHLTQEYVSGKGFILCVNLLDTEGDEGELTSNYEYALKSSFDSTRIKYKIFPVNRVKGIDGVPSLNQLKPQIQDELLSQKCFVGEGRIPGFHGFKKNTNSINTPMKILQLQNGVVRVNCLDSIDRTNYAMSLIGRQLLPYMITWMEHAHDLNLNLNSSLGSTPSQEDVLSHLKQLSNVNDRKCAELAAPRLRFLWAAAGDAISLIYTGTVAMKRESVLTGKEPSWKNNCQDAINGIERYYQNHFFDGELQVSLSKFFFFFSFSFF